MAVSSVSPTNLAAQLATLRLPPSASATDVKRAFRQIVREHHPDATGRRDASHKLLTAVFTAYREINRSGGLAERVDDGRRVNGRLVDVLA